MDTATGNERRIDGMVERAVSVLTTSQWRREGGEGACVPGGTLQGAAFEGVNMEF